MNCVTGNTSGVSTGITSVANVWADKEARKRAQASGKTQMSTEEYLKAKAKIEDQVDYEFIQRVIQELTQSCALNLPIPPSAIPPLIIQAAQWFWQNCDYSIEERYYCVRNCDFQKCGPNMTVKLPPQIISVFGVNKLNDEFQYGVMGDFSIERMIMNTAAWASGMGGSLANTFGAPGYTLTDVTAALYEVQTYQSLFEVPLSFNYNEFSNELIVLGDLGTSDLILQCFKRLKIQDMYKNYYFFRLVVAFALRSMGTIMGTISFKLPGGAEINYDRFNTLAESYIEEVTEWVNKQHTADYILTSNSI